MKNDDDVFAARAIIAMVLRGTYRLVFDSAFGFITFSWHGSILERRIYFNLSKAMSNKKQSKKTNYFLGKCY